MALKFVRLSRRGLPWFLLFAAIACFVLGEGVTVAGILSGSLSDTTQSGFYPWLGLIVSLLFFCGMAGLRPGRGETGGVSTAEREGDSRYRALFDECRDAIYLVDREGRIIDLNPALEELCGYARSELIGMDVSLLYLDPGGRGEFLRRLRQEGIVRAHEMALVRRDGTVMECQITASLKSDGRDDGAEYQGIIRDISGRIRMEEMLRLNSGILNAILTASPIGICMVQDRSLIWVNDTMHRMLDYEPPDLHGKSARILYANEEEFERVGRELYGKTNASGLSRSVARWMRADGTLFDCLLQASCFGTGEGEESGTIIAVMDVSVLKRAEVRLRESERRYRAFFEDDLTGDYVMTPDGTLLDCNAAFARIFGFEGVEEAMKMDFNGLCADATLGDELIERLRHERKLEYHQRELRRVDGKPVHVIENIIGVFDSEGNLTRVRGYLFDNTAQKNLEEQLLHSQKMEAIGRLAGGVAHDFNNLLTAITGYCDLVLMGLGDGHPLYRKVEEIKKAGDRAATLTRQLLAFSRKQVLLPKVITLNSVISEMEKMLRRLIGEDIHLETVLDPDPGLVKADPGQIEQVIMNLAVNARDAMPRGGRLVIGTETVELDEEYTRTHVGVTPGEYVMLTVSDTGSGMDEETKSRLFEPFFTTKERDKGTGLGLATTYGIVAQSSGHIRVESAPGQGAVFRVLLPCVQRESPKRKPGVDAARPGNGGSETILLVEDDEVVRSILVESLVAGGYKVFGAGHAEEALEIADHYSTSIDLLVTDLIMPGMDGRELAEILCSRHPHLKLLFMSGYSDQSLSEGGESAAPRGAFLQKPFRLNALAEKIREILGS